jgi:hypothetical protein
VTPQLHVTEAINAGGEGGRDTDSRGDAKGSTIIDSMTADVEETRQ